MFVLWPVISLSALAKGLASNTAALCFAVSWLGLARSCLSTWHEPSLQDVDLAFYPSLSSPRTVRTRPVIGLNNFSCCNFMHLMTLRKSPRMPDASYSSSLTKCTAHLQPVSCVCILERSEPSRQPVLGADCNRSRWWSGRLRRPPLNSCSFCFRAPLATSHYVALVVWRVDGENRRWTP